MDMESLGAGAGSGGLVGVVLTWLGLRSKINDIDKNHDSLEKRFEEHTKEVVLKDACNQIHNTTTQKFDKLDKFMEKQTESLSKISVSVAVLEEMSKNMKKRNGDK